MAVRKWRKMNLWWIAAPTIAAAGAVSYGAVWPGSQLFGPTIRHSKSPRKLAITFDDGPNPSITPKLLDLLERYNGHATFFLIGQFVRQRPELVREMAARGHSLGNHTETHPNLFKCPPSRIRDELRRCNDAIEKAAQVTPKWFRPPFGLRNPWVIPAAGDLYQQTVMWTVLPGDWKAQSAEWLIPRMEPVAKRARQLSHGNSNREFTAKKTGDILCVHDGNHRTLTGDRRCTLAALEYWFPRWRDLGLEFVTIDNAVADQDVGGKA